MKTELRYKFLREGLKSNSGNCTWKVGVWKKHKGEVELCESGFHCSKEIYQAFTYVQGEILALVEVKGKSDIKSDKEAWSEMKIVKAWKWQKQDSVALSIYAAELCIENFEKVYPNDSRPRDAIKAAKKWLKNPTKENKSAAYSAARSAYSAADSAAYSVAHSADSAAYSAADSAAYSAAHSAARSAYSAADSAAYSALIENISKWMDRRLKKLEAL